MQILICTLIFLVQSSKLNFLLCFHYFSLDKFVRKYIHTLMNFGLVRE